ncbi:hypothetical protein GCM10027614_43640 [Micromonospora vulcania]
MRRLSPAPGAGHTLQQGVDDVSERAQQNRSADQDQSPATKSGRRLAAQLAEKKAAEARRRRNAWTGGLAGVGVVAVLIIVFVAFGRGDDDKPSNQADATPRPPPLPRTRPVLPRHRSFRRTPTRRWAASRRSRRARVT